MVGEEIRRVPEASGSAVVSFSGASGKAGSAPGLVSFRRNTSDFITVVISSAKLLSPRLPSL